MSKNRHGLWTVGHSTRPIEEFIEALNSFEIKILADVRSFPGSRRYPQFNQAQLATSLTEVGIEYQHFPELGGRRRAHPQSHNIAWRNESFRGYADYMETEDFRKGIARLCNLARARHAAIMCAEALWWQCHRSMVADYLMSLGAEVQHILGPEKTEPHRYTAPARIVNGQLTYHAVEEQMLIK